MEFGSICDKWLAIRYSDEITTHDKVMFDSHIYFLNHKLLNYAILSMSVFLITASCQQGLNKHQVNNDMIHINQNFYIRNQRNQWTSIKSGIINIHYESPSSHSLKL